MSITPHREATDHIKERFARMGTELLLARIIAAQDRFAHEGGMTLSEAQQFLMGGNYAPPIPGTERIRKTSEIERMAA